MKIDCGYGQCAAQMGHVLEKQAPACQCTDIAMPLQGRFLLQRETLSQRAPLLYRRRQCAVHGFRRTHLFSLGEVVVTMTVYSPVDTGDPDTCMRHSVGLWLIPEWFLFVQSSFSQCLHLSPLFPKPHRTHVTRMQSQ